ncbi:MAG: MarR family transcriptional regulator [Candidatus Dormibacteraeota bacterium]|nr:MarR family transcriptional regulator [Candidatus Dormibacteraeota bacterium]
MTECESPFATDENGRLYNRRVREHLVANRAHPDVATTEALAALRTASHHFHVTMDRWLERHQLSEGRMGVLWRLQGTGPMTLGDLADALDVSPRNVTGLIDHLERDGLVERSPDLDDRRATRVRLTATGEATLQLVRSEMGEARRNVLAGFSEDEINQFRHLCLKLVQNLKVEREAKV